MSKVLHPIYNQDLLLEKINYKIRNYLKRGAFYQLAGMPNEYETLSPGFTGWTVYGSPVDLRMASFTVHLQQNKMQECAEGHAIDDMEFSSYYFSKGVMDYLPGFVYDRIRTVLYDLSFNSTPWVVGDIPFIIGWTSSIAKSPSFPGWDYEFQGMLIPNSERIQIYKPICTGCSNQILCMFGRKITTPCRIVEKHFSPEVEKS